MNFLGHIFLTPDDDELLLGNFIADSVKGNPYNKLPERVADGVKLHRAIDAFTDSHTIVKKGAARFRSSQGRYASVVIDLVYDHVLASNWKQFHDDDLKLFVDDVYQRLELNSQHFPKRVEQFFPYMKTQNWLYNYQFEWGFKKSLEGLDRRSAVDTQMVNAVEVYRENQLEFLEEFGQFISDAKQMVASHSS